MGDILDEAADMVQCQECPWYKSCVTPMRFSMSDIMRQLPGAALGDDDTISRYLAEMASATQNVIIEGCPIFIQRLRASPKLAEQLKKMMRNWGMEE